MWEPLEESQLLISRQANGFDALSVEHHALFYKPWVYTKSFTLFSPVLKAMAMLKPPGTTSLFHLLYSPTTKETMYKTPCPFYSRGNLSDFTSKLVDEDISESTDY